jgi:hypothetical protein
MPTDAVRNVVLVHGGFVDGSGWQGVYESLTRDGFRVSIVQNPTLSLEGDAAATRWVLDAQDGRRHRIGDRGQPLRLCVAAGSGSHLHRPGRSGPCRPVAHARDRPDRTAGHPLYGAGRMLDPI